MIFIIGAIFQKKMALGKDMLQFLMGTCVMCLMHLHLYGIQEVYVCERTTKWQHLKMISKYRIPPCFGQNPIFSKKSCFTCVIVFWNHILKTRFGLENMISNHNFKLWVVAKVRFPQKITKPRIQLFTYSNFNLVLPKLPSNTDSYH